MSDKLTDSRETLYGAFLRLLEASWADRESITDSEIIEAADDLDDAVGELVVALRDSRRGTIAEQ